MSNKQEKPFYILSSEYDSLKYIKQKHDKAKGIYYPEKNDIDMKTLSLLDDLGFPMDKIGTYLLKDLAIYIAKTDLKNYYVMMEDPSKYNEIWKKLSVYPSPIIEDFAKNNLEIRPDGLIDYILDSIKNIDNKRINKELERETFVTNKVEDDEIKQLADYAFSTATYIAKKEYIEGEKIGEFSLIDCNDEEYVFSVYTSLNNNRKICCKELNINTEIVYLKPRIEVLIQGNCIKYSDKVYKNGKMLPIIKKVNIDSYMLDYLKDHDMIYYSSQVAAIYDLPDKKGYDYRESGTPYKRNKAKKSLKLERDMLSI